MKTPHLPHPQHVLRIVLPPMLLCLLHGAAAGDIYKYRMRDGGILYTQEKQKNAKLLAVIKPPPTDASQAAAREAALRRVEEERARADRLTDLRLSNAQSASPQQASAAVLSTRSEPPPAFADYGFPLGPYAYGYPYGYGLGYAPYGVFGGFGNRSGHGFSRRHGPFFNGGASFPPFIPGTTITQPFKWPPVPTFPGRHFSGGFAIRR